MVTEVSNKIKIISLSVIIFLCIIFLINFDVSTIFNKIIALTIFFPSIINLLYLINIKYPKLGKGMSILGDISYSIYLIHFSIILIILFLLNALDLKINFNMPIFFFIYLIITFLISFCSYKFIEIPLRRILRNRYLKK